MRIEKFQYIREFSQFENREVTIKGWVSNKRDSKGLVFIIMRDGTTVQEFTVKKGDQFQIPGTGKTFRVISVEEDSAVISSVDEKGQLGPQIPITRR